MLSFYYPFPELHPDDLAIPRTRLVAYEQQFVDHQPAVGVDYLYRVDYLEHWTFTSIPFRNRCLTAGHQYRTELGNVLNYRGRGIGYIEETCAHIDLIAGQNLLPHRLYVFPTITGAKAMQMKSIQGDMNVDMNALGILTFDFNPLYLFQHLGIISRVATANMPTGAFFPDPNTPDDPTAAIHILGSEGPVFIPPENIQFCINDTWVEHDDVDIEAIEQAAREGDVSSILCGLV